MKVKPELPRPFDVLDRTIRRSAAGAAHAAGAVAPPARHSRIPRYRLRQTPQSSLGIDDDTWNTKYRDVLFSLTIAKVNDGRLEAIPNPHVMTKKNEVVHLEMMAALMKEVLKREFRGGSQGVSFRIAKGVRYRVGAFRGHSVVVGSELQVADTGVLAVTTTRIVFMGSRKTMEVPFAKLVGMDVFSDGLRFHASNRQNAPLFKLASGDVVAATINAAAQRLEA